MPISHRHRPLVYPDYIDPLPAEDIIRIGAVKQDLYDKNYEKIQNHINELDKYGLELVRDIDKKYFSQEMNKYMKSINESVGKTDFSNMANLRSVLAVSRPIQNDKLILNSIKSSQELRNRQKTLASLKPGERNPANEWHYMKDVKDWQNNPEVGAVLGSKEYVPFVDPSEYINKIVKDIKPKIKTEIIAKGAYRDVREIEEVTNDRLLQWMKQNLPEQYKQQIMIDAMYTTKDIDPGEMANYYFDTRLNQYNQIKQLMAQYEKYGNNLTEEDKEDYITLATRAKILQRTLSNPPETEEAAQNAWINDHYNDYLTGQADLYAYRQEKRKLEEDKFSLAQFQSNLRKQEAYYRNITLEKEKERLGIQSNTGSSGGTVKTPSGQKVDKRTLNKELDAAKEANKLFKRYTNNLTSSEEYEPVDVKSLDDDEKEELKQVLRDALKIYANNPGSKVSKKDVQEGSVRLTDLQVRKKDDGTYSFRVNLGDRRGLFTGDIIYEVDQDVFDDAFRSIKGLDNVDFEHSVNSKSARNEPVTGSGASAEELTQEEIDNFYNSQLPTE